MKKLIIIGLMLATPILAHQPVMDMAPRWKNGYGIQTRFETSHKSNLINGKNRIDNPLNLFSEASTLWTEGVYTFTREHRISFKLPYTSKVVQKEANNERTRLADHGFGDLILGFINKWYFNRPGLTGNFSLTPSIKLPTGKDSDIVTLGSGTTDYGLSMSFNAEGYLYYGLIDLFTWIRSAQDNGVHDGHLIGLDIDLGYHPIHNMSDNSGMFVMTGINARHNLSASTRGITDPNSGGTTAEVVPTLVWYQHNIMARVQFHIPIYANLNGIQLAPTSGFQAGIGIAY